jgi:hypothetical protein
MALFKRAHLKAVDLGQNPKLYLAQMLILLKYLLIPPVW